MVLFVWGGRLGTFVNYPDFELGLSAILWTYNEEKDRTNIFIAARLVNRGAPSVTQAWSARYFAGPSEEDMKGYYLVGPWVITLEGKERLTLENTDLLNVKTAEKAVERGGAVHGRLFFVLQGKRDDQLKSLQFKIVVKVHYTRREYSAVYRSSSTPRTELLRHPFEKGEFIKGPDTPESADGRTAENRTAP